MTINEVIASLNGALKEVFPELRFTEHRETTTEQPYVWLKAGALVIEPKGMSSKKFSLPIELAYFGVDPALQQNETMAIIQKVSDRVWLTLDEGIRVHSSKAVIVENVYYYTFTLEWVNAYIEAPVPWMENLYEE